MTHRFLRTVCRALIGVVLLAQLAVAAYACPGLASAATGHEAIACEDMATPMDPSFANLCAEHCHHGQQSDHTATLTVPAAVLNALYITAAAPEPRAAPRPAADATSARAAAALPHAILHCCFRI